MPQFSLFSLVFLYFWFYLWCFGEFVFTIGHEVVLAPLFLNSYKSFVDSVSELWLRIKKKRLSD